MSEYRHLKCLQPAIKEKCPVMFCWKWTISKYCTRERRLVLYAKTGNQETLPSIFNWAPDLPVSLGKSARPSVSSSVSWGWSPWPCSLGWPRVGKHHCKFKTLLTITYYCLPASPKKAAEQDKDPGLNDHAPCFYTCERRFMHQNWEQNTCKVPSNANVFWFPLTLPVLAALGLTIRMQAVVEGWNTRRLASKDPLPWGTECSSEEPSLTTITMPTSPRWRLSSLRCQWQNDFQTLPRF